MIKLRALWLTGALTLVASSAAFAQTAGNSNRINLARLVDSYAASRYAAQPGPTTVNPLTYVSLRGGGMVSPRGAGLVGVDISLPTVVIPNTGWHGRIDADVIIKGNFAGTDTVVPLTFDLLYYSPTAAAGHNVYWGGGLGAVLGGHDPRFDGKLVLGTELTTRLGAELNLHFTEGDTLVTILGRLHL